MNFGLYKKSIFKEIGLYDTQFKYYECDHDMTARCLNFGKRVTNVNNIKVFELQTEKRSIPYNEDRNLFFKNLTEFYSNRILPETIEML